VQRVADAFAYLVSPPALVAVAARARHHLQPFALAHRLGLVYLEALGDPERCASVWQAVQPVLSVWRDAAHSGSPIDTSLGRLDALVSREADAGCCDRRC
jgi:hypothetical protein